MEVGNRRISIDRDNTKTKTASSARKHRGYGTSPNKSLDQNNNNNDNNSNNNNNAAQSKSRGSESGGNLLELGAQSALGKPRSTSLTDLLLLDAGKAQGTVNLFEKTCLAILGASMTGPMYFVMYCMGWMKHHQGNSITLEFLITFYPVALAILLVQVGFDHMIDRVMGRRLVCIIRFTICGLINTSLVPLTWMTIDNTRGLLVIFALLGFAHGAMLGSSFEYCLQMHKNSKAIEYLNVGLQVGGVAEGIFGVMSGLTTQSHPTVTQFYIFAALTSVLCVSGVISVFVLNCYSDRFKKVMKLAPEPPPSSLSEICKVCWNLRVSILATILTSGSTLLCNGFYTYVPTALMPEPLDNAILVVLLVYTNLFSDLFGRMIVTRLDCPTGSALVQFALGRQLLVIGFFFYLCQRYLLNDIGILALLTIIMISHGMITTWSFVHAHRAIPDERHSAFVSKMCVIILFTAILTGSFLGRGLEIMYFLPVETE